MEDKKLGVGTTQADCEGLEDSKTPFRDILANTKTHGMIAQDIKVLVELFHGANREAGWWDQTEEQSRAQEILDSEVLSDVVKDFVSGIVDKERDPLTMQILMISEIIEAMEGIRKNLMDDKLPNHKNEDVEIADLFIRLMDYAGGRGIELGKIVCEKAAFNIQREDHKKANRALENGKKF